MNKEVNLTRKQIGRLGLSSAINYFTINGYTISLPINDTQWYDLIVEKDNVFQTVQCKATNTEDNTISLRSFGGTKGSEIDNVLNHPVDLLFCVDGKLNMWNIPVDDIRKSKNKKSITLRFEETSNGQGFQTHKYLVKFTNG